MKRVNLPTIQGAPPRERVFPAYPVALQALIINEDERFLLLSSPTRNGHNEWQVISGGLDANETILDGLLREVGEEAGADVRVRPLTTIHTQTFTFDSHIPFMIGIYFLLAYEGGNVVPGDDMAGSNIRWWSVSELEQAEIRFHPSTHLWMLKRGVEMYRMLRERPLPPSVLQPPLFKDPKGFNA
ncbi:MAG: NUDIX hydrolase [Anaerolineales bacterium]|nr:NUDIX hydrolase [Anaerolineales bacterium]